MKINAPVELDSEAVNERDVNAAKQFDLVCWDLADPHSHTHPMMAWSPKCPDGLGCSGIHASSSTDI